MYCLLPFTLLATLRISFVKVKAIAIDSGSLEIRDNLVNNGDISTNFENLSPSSDDASLWNDEFDLASVPGCNGPQSSLDSGNLYDSEDLFSSSNIDDNGSLFGRGLEDFSTQLENFAAPLKILSNPACVNQDFQFRTPPKGNTNTEGNGQSTGQQDENQNQEPQASLDDLLVPLQIELVPKCPQDPEYGYVEDLCCPIGPTGLRNLFWHDCVPYDPNNPICQWGRKCCIAYHSGWQTGADCVPFGGPYPFVADPHPMRITTPEEGLK